MNSSTVFNVSCILEDIVDRDVLTPDSWDYSGNHIDTSLQLVFFLLGVPLNLYVMVKILCKKLYSQPTYLLLFNLAFCDFLVCMITLLFNVITEFNGHHSFGDSDYVRCQVCKIAVAYIMLNLLTTFNLALLSLDRFAFFYIPLKYNKKVTPRKTVFALLGIWLLSGALVIAPLVGYGDFGFSLSCELPFTKREHIIRSIFQFVVTAVAFSAVVLTLGVTNIWIVCIAYKQIKAVKSERIELQNIDIATTDQKKQEKIIRNEAAQKQFKLFRVFGGILLVNFATYLLAIVLPVCLIFITYAPLELLISVKLTILSQVVLHPLIEAFLTPELQATFPPAVKICCTKIGGTKVGGVLRACYAKVTCRSCAELCTAALEKGLDEDQA